MEPDPDVEVDPDPVLTISAAAHRLGVAVPTLRSWDRRYGLSASSHSQGGHRRYTTQDMARLRRMVALTGDGVPPAAAARLAHGEDDSILGIRHGGGSGVVAVGPADPVVRGLSRDAVRLDVDALDRRLSAQIDVRGVADTWTSLLVPLLRSLGAAYERTPERVVPIEHAATAGVLSALRDIRPATQHGRLPALLACAPDEQHSLPLEALRAALAEQGTAARFLGARLPAEALCRATARLNPITVLVWAHSPKLARRVPLVQIADRGSALLLAGPGWSKMRTGNPYPRPASLEEAIQLITTAAGRPAPDSLTPGSTFPTAEQ